MTPEINLVGHRYGRLTVIRKTTHVGRNARWICRCDCGNEKIVYRSSLRSGNTRSCGCLHRSMVRTANLTHGGHGHINYNNWRAMMERCHNPKCKDFKRYGAVGITVCEAWHDFNTFVFDMGTKPSSDHSIDRYPNCKGNYEPSNCRWATSKQQSNNRSVNVRFQYQNKSLTLAEWSEHLNIPCSTLFNRIKANWTLERTFTTLRKVRVTRGHS